jgi:hypothetical protein
MPRPEKKKYDRLVWFVLPLMVMCAPVANAIGDMILVCVVYGPDAYFKDGLRVMQHKPFTLSTGAVLSQELGGLGWFIDTAVWLGLVFLSMCILGAIYTRIKRWRRHQGKPAP